MLTMSRSKFNSMYVSKGTMDKVSEIIEKQNNETNFTKDFEQNVLDRLHID